MRFSSTILAAAWPGHGHRHPSVGAPRPLPDPRQPQHRFADKQLRLRARRHGASGRPIFKVEFSNAKRMSGRRDSAPPRS